MYSCRRVFKSGEETSYVPIIEPDWDLDVDFVEDDEDEEPEFPDEFD